MADSSLRIFPIRKVGNADPDLVPDGCQEHSGAGPGVHRSKPPGLASVRLFVVVAVLGGLPPLEPPVNFVGGRVPPLQHPVLEAR